MMAIRTLVSSIVLLAILVIINGQTELGTYLPKAASQDCGLRAATGFILGGEDAKRGDFPFIASLGYKDPTKDGHTVYACGGALINRRYVLTAAHCQTDAAPIIEVVLGEHDVAHDPDCENCPKVQRFNITKEDVKVHEGYKPREVATNGDDLALVRLPTLAITSNEVPEENVLPICMVFENTLKMPTKENIVMGWGRTNNDDTDHGSQATSGAFSSILQKLVVPEVPYETCKMKPLFKGISPVKHICAGGEEGKDSCSGDSGGPLVARDAIDKPMYLKGIVSFGTKKCGKGLPGVYINVTHYIPWITENLKP